MYKHILVPTDGSNLSLKAARAAGALASRLRAKVTAVHVIPTYVPPIPSEGMIPYPEMLSPEAYRKATEKQAATALGKIAKAVAAKKVACDTFFLTHDRPWEGIIKAAAMKKCDLIVMAFHGRGGIAGILLGSETTKVLTHSKIPVLVCR
jgi:nucleotide-binding universal stress UspA family protein